MYRNGGISLGRYEYWAPPLGGAGEVICCPKLHSSLTFSHLADNREPHIFHTSIVMTEASSWNWFGVNNGGIYSANGFSCDRIMCYIIDQRPTFQKLMVGAPHYPPPRLMTSFLLKMTSHNHVITMCSQP